MSFDPNIKPATNSSNSSTSTTTLNSLSSSSAPASKEKTSTINYNGKTTSFAVGIATKEEISKSLETIQATLTQYASTDPNSNEFPSLAQVLKLQFAMNKLTQMTEMMTSMLNFRPPLATREAEELLHKQRLEFQAEKRKEEHKAKES